MASKTPSSDSSAVEPEAPAFRFRVAQRVTVPLLSMKDLFEVPVYIRVETEFKKADPVKASKNDDDSPKQEPPIICRVTNLETGELNDFIVPVVLRSELEENYPNAGYIGKCFEVIKRKLDGTKKYNTFSITEIVPE